MDRRIVAFFDELEKIAATVLMKKLSPAARKYMQRLTGFTGKAEKAAPTSSRRLRRALMGKKSPKLMTEMHGLRKELTPVELEAKRQARRHADSVLRRQGKIYKGRPGLEKDITAISGPTKPFDKGTVASTPAAIRAREAA